MVLLNFFFVLLNGYLAVYWLDENPKKWIGWVNLAAFALNLIPVIEKLLS